MGGISISRFTFDWAGHAVFEGTVSLRNGGGFASIRRSSLQLGGHATLAYSLTAWGDSRTYKLNLRTDAGFDGVKYQVGFNPAEGQWSQIILPITEFLPTSRGRVVQGAPALRPELVTQVGLMISDQQAGPFRLLVKSIAAIESKTATEIGVVVAEGITRQGDVQFESI